MGYGGVNQGKKLFLSICTVKHDLIRDVHNLEKFFLVWAFPVLKVLFLNLVVHLMRLLPIITLKINHIDREYLMVEILRHHLKYLIQTPELIDWLNISP